MKYLTIILALSLSSPATEESPSSMAGLLQYAAPVKTFVRSAEDGGDTWQYSFDKHGIQLLTFIFCCVLPPTVKLVYVIEQDRCDLQKSAASLCPIMQNS